MAILYDKRKMVLNFKEDKPTVYLIKQVGHQVVPFDRVLDEASSACGVNRAQVKAAVEAVLDRSILFMDFGLSVNMGDFGTFKPVINVKSQENEEDLGADNVTRRKIRFYPGKRFKTMLNGLSMTRAGESANSSTGNNDDGGDDGGFTPDPNA